MIKKLIAKAQIISTTQPASAGAFSGVLLITPEDVNLLERKGSVYAVFDLSGSQEFDVNLVTKVVHDVLHDSYYQSDNISPVQSLEKSIVEVRDKVTKLTNESIRTSEGNVEFSMVACVLWGNVIYVVQYGRVGSFLLREGNIKPLNTNTEGHFATASGVVKEEEVALFATMAFMKKISPEKLLSSNIDPADLSPDASCLLLKFTVDTTFTESEVVDFPMPRESKWSPFRRSHKEKSVARTPGQTTEPSPSSVPPPKTEPHQPIDIKLKPIKGIKFKPNRTLIIGIVGLLLIASIVYTVKSNIKRNADSKDTPDEVLSTNIDTPLPPKEEPKEEEVDKTVFYDIKLTDNNADPSAIAVLSDKVAVADKNTGKVYISELATPKFTSLEATFMGVSGLESSDGNLGFFDNEGYKVMDLVTKEIKSTVKTEKTGVSASYLGNAYVISGDTLIKYTSDGTSSTWAQSADLEGTRSMDIAVSIFILKNDGTLISYTTGTKDSFSVTGLETPLVSPVQVVTDYDFDNIYIADAGNRRVVVLDKKGAFVKEIRHENPAVWGNMKGIDVTSDEKKIFILDGSKVHEIALE